MNAFWKTIKSPVYIVLTVVVILAMASAVFADDISNNIDATVDATAEVMTLTVGGPDGSTTFYVIPTNGDGKNGCNLTGSTTLTVQVNTNNSSVVTVSPSSITFTSCGDAPALTISPVAVGSATISLSQISNTTAGSFNLTPATFNVNVSAAPTLPPPADTTAPVITPNISGTLGNNGWYISDVTVSWNISDPDSSISTSTGCGTTTLDAETKGTTLTCSATSAGGSASQSVTVKLDKTAPSAALAVTAGTAGANGWYTSDVTVSTSGSDNVSSPVTCTALQSLKSESKGITFNGSCTNDAGLTTDATHLTVKLDKTGPTAALAVTAGTLGLNGWYTSDVTVSTIGNDDISSPVTCTADQSLSIDSAGTVFSGSCTNDAGLTTNADPLTVKLDKTPPVLNPTVSPNPVLLNGTATASPNASDATSGVAASSCENVDTSSVGVKSVTCTATDNAGNTVSQSVSYTVVYKICALYDQTKSHKAGSTVPVKLQLCDANGVNQSSAVIVVKSVSLAKGDSIASNTVEDSGNANPDSNFRYDPTLGGTGGYIFNLSTKGLTTGTWNLSFSVDGTGSYLVRFDVK